ncbi:MAG: nucleotidyltransferase family protein [Gemmatimonadaceae bacterium]
MRSEVPPAIAIDAARLEAACRRLGARMVVLFGSQATGSPPPGPTSDVDLAVRVSRHDPQVLWDCYAAFGAVFPGRSVDLVMLPTDDPLLRWEIMRDGVLLHGSIDEFLEYRAFAYRDFVDSADLRALEKTLSERKLARIRALTSAAS